MIKRFVLAVLAVGMLTFVAAAPAAPAFARLDNDEPGGPTGTGGCGGGGVAGFLGFRSWDACLEKDSSGAPIIRALEDVWKIAVIIVEFFIKVSGYLAAGFIIWGGIKYLKSQGEPGETAQARQIINNALMGLIICLLAVAIVQFIAGTF